MIDDWPDVPMYVRFAVTQTDEDSGYPMGVFMATNELRDSRDTRPELAEHIRTLRRWFHENLPAPGDSGKDVAKEAISWFKTDAGECIKRIWTLIHVLQDAGYVVKKITSTRPGKIVYEDEYQVAAIPFRDIRHKL